MQIIYKLNFIEKFIVANVCANTSYTYIGLRLNNDKAKKVNTN